MLVGAAILSASASLLAGCATTPLVGPGAVIRYRQIGACQSSKAAGISSVSQNAFVLFQIDSIRNDNSNVDFNFVPTRLFVNDRQYMSTTSPILAALNTGPAPGKTVSHGTQWDLPPKAFGVVTVATAANAGAGEANQIPFFLNYDAQANDPPVIGAKLDLTRSVWPDTADCGDISPTLGQNAYMLQKGAISTFKIDPGSGALTDPGESVPSYNVGSFTVDPRGRFVFGLDSTVGEIRTFPIQPDGSLAPVIPGAAATTPYTTGILIDPAGEFLYVQSVSGIDTFRYNEYTGHPDPIGASGHIDALGIDSVVVAGNGYLYVLTSFPQETLTVYAVDRSKKYFGTLTPVQTLPISQFGGAGFLAINPASGYLYVCDNVARNVRVFQFDPATSALTELPVGPVPLPGTTGSLSLAFDPGGEFLYVTGGDVGTSGLGAYVYSVAATGALKSMPSVPGVSAVVAEPTGRYLYAVKYTGFTSEVTGYKLDLTTPAPGTPLQVYSWPLTIPGTY